MRFKTRIFIIIFYLCKSRRMRWVVHVALMGEIREAYKIVPADM
jgi:hypothetical protein